MLKGSPYMLNSEHKPIARAPLASSNKENEKQPSKRTEERINLFSQTSNCSAQKSEFMDKFETKKQKQMSSATTMSTVAQCTTASASQETNCTAKDSVVSKTSRRRGKTGMSSRTKIGVKRKAAIPTGKSSP